MRLYRDRVPPDLVDQRSTSPAAAVRDRVEQRPIVEPTLPRAALQLQLYATSEGDHNIVEGAIANYGRIAASEVMILIGENGDIATIEISALDNDTSQRIAARMDSIQEGTSVLVRYSSAGKSFQQRGKFEKAVGRESVFLLKGLDLARSTD